MNAGVSYMTPTLQAMNEQKADIAVMPMPLNFDTKDVYTEKEAVILYIPEENREAEKLIEKIRGTFFLETKDGLKVFVLSRRIEETYELIDATGFDICLNYDY